MANANCVPKNLIHSGNLEFVSANKVIMKRGTDALKKENGMVMILRACVLLEHTLMISKRNVFLVLMAA